MALPMGGGNENVSEDAAKDGSIELRPGGEKTSALDRAPGCLN